MVEAGNAVDGALLDGQVAVAHLQRQQQLGAAVAHPAPLACQLLGLLAVFLRHSYVFAQLVDLADFLQHLGTVEHLFFLAFKTRLVVVLSEVVDIPLAMLEEQVEHHLVVVEVMHHQLHLCRRVSDMTHFLQLVAPVLRHILPHNPVVGIDADGALTSADSLGFFEQFQIARGAIETIVVHCRHAFALRAVRRRRITKVAVDRLYALTDVSLGVALIVGNCRRSSHLCGVSVAPCPTLRLIATGGKSQ